MTAFGLWIARGAAGRDAQGPAEELLEEAHRLLGDSDGLGRLADRIDRQAGMALYRKAKDFQNQIKKVHWTMVRTIESWPLFLVEEGLAVHLGLHQTPSDGYRLAANWAKHYDARYGTDLNGPSAGKLHELARFVVAVEELEARNP